MRRVLGLLGGGVATVAGALALASPALAVTPSFGPAVNIPTGGNTGVFVAAGDLNRDGVLDLTVANQGSGSVTVALA